MKDKEYLSFLKMIEKAIKYTEGYTFEQFCEDKKQLMQQYLQ